MIECCEQFITKLSGLIKTMHIYYLTVSTGWESRQGVAGSSVSGSHKAAFKVLARAASRGTWTDGLSFLLAVGWKWLPSVPKSRGPRWFSPSEKAHKKSQREC